MLLQPFKVAAANLLSYVCAKPLALQTPFWNSKMRLKLISQPTTSPVLGVFYTRKPCEHRNGMVFVLYSGSCFCTLSGKSLWTELCSNSAVSHPHGQLASCKTGQWVGLQLGVSPCFRQILSRRSSAQDGCGHPWFVLLQRASITTYNLCISEGWV